MTNNAINSNIPIVVSQGGTGATTLTNNGVLVGATTAAITALSVGNTGELLVGVTGANPAFGTSATGDFTFTSATANTNRIVTVSNTDNTGAATSQATVQVTVGGANVGDPKTTYTVTGATSFTTGIDNSAADAYKISASTALGTTDTFIMTTAGECTMPLQPAFAAYNSVTDDNVTGDAGGTLYTIIFDTELFDQNSDYNNGTGIFTAPVTGRYFFTASCVLAGLAVGNTLADIRIVYTGADYVVNVINPGVAMSSSATIGLQISIEVGMATSDTVKVQVRAYGTAKVVDVVGDAASPFNTVFSGYLMV